MLKKMIGGVVSLTLLMTGLTSTVNAGEGPVKIYINNETILFDENPIVENDVTFVQFRPLMERLGLTVTWNNEILGIEAKNAHNTIQLQIDNPIAVVNSLEKRMESPAVIINGYTFVPLRFVSEATGASVKWDASSKTIAVTLTANTAGEKKEQIVSEQPANPAPVQPVKPVKPVKAKKDKYTVDSIVALMDSSGIGLQSATNKYSSLVIDSRNRAYILQDRNTNKASYSPKWASVLKINLENGDIVYEPSMEDNYSYEFINASGKKETSKAMDFVPQMMAYDNKAGQLIIGGLSSNFGSYLLSYHEHYPQTHLLSYHRTNATSVLDINNFFKMADDDTFMYSDLSNREIYLQPRGGQPVLVASFTEDSGIKVINNYIEAVLTEDAVYLFDSFNCALFRIDRSDHKLTKVYEDKHFLVNSVTSHDGKFYIKGKGGIYELDTTGAWSTFIDDKQLEYNTPYPNFPLSRPPNYYTYMAFDADENLVLLHGGYSMAIERINR